MLVFSIVWHSCQERLVSTNPFTLLVYTTVYSIPKLKKMLRRQSSTIVLDVKQFSILPKMIVFDLGNDLSLIQFKLLLILTRAAVCLLLLTMHVNRLHTLASLD